MAHQHILGYLVSYDGVEDVIKVQVAVLWMTYSATEANVLEVIRPFVAEDINNSAIRAGHYSYWKLSSLSDQLYRVTDL